MAEQLLEVLRMANALEKLIEDTLVRGREEGSIEGEVAGFREAVRLALLQLVALDTDEQGMQQSSVRRCVSRCCNASGRCRPR